MNELSLRVPAAVAVFGAMLTLSSGCSRTELSEFGDPKVWQIEYPCADNRYTEAESTFELADRPLADEGNDWETPCGPDVTPSGPDETILWEAPAPGVYRVSATMPFSTVGLFVLRDSCGADVPACDTGEAFAEVYVDVVEGESLIFVVDAIQPDDAGSYRLSVERVAAAPTRGDAGEGSGGGTTDGSGGFDGSGFDTTDPVPAP